LILRKRGSSDWTTDMDNTFAAWIKKYIDWLGSSPSGKTAASSEKCVYMAGAVVDHCLQAICSNHGTIFVNQLAALKLLINDTAGAASLTDGYFKGIFQKQVQANGDQVCSLFFS
jgi:NAD(P)H-dependent FMN reductase